MGASIADRVRAQYERHPYPPVSALALPRRKPEAELALDTGLTLAPARVFPEHPRILVAGLNPHAGEGGYLGREEIDVIAPVLEQLRAEGLNVIGPLPADTLFTARCLQGSDAQVAMYHDQGLAVLKHASFGAGVNVTLGLPIIRTSVDHGTALDLAGTGQADPGSLFEAVELAIDMSRRAQAAPSAKEGA